ncbi:MAG TPA: hypothetical protein VHZ28_04135 [Terracidiphilus sp.]|jgi:hypothetical protein|nr:hypothetical protein [Terracidiphilus sp.]
MNTAAQLDHQFVTAAYIITWTLQLGFLAYIGLKWRAEKRSAAQRNQRPR